MKPHPRLSSHSWRILAGMTLTVTAFALLPSTPVHARRTVAAAAVVNAASYATTVAPGSIAALFSTDLTQQAGQPAGTIPLPTSLAGLSVKIGGITAPLFYASATQINLQIPSAVASGSCTTPATTSGNEAAVSVPRLERGTAWPVSTETGARCPSHFGYALSSCARPATTVMPIMGRRVHCICRDLGASRLPSWTPCGKDDGS